MNMENIRVLQILNSLGRGGIETFITGVYKNIDRTKIQFDFCIVDGMSTDHLEEVRSLGANVYFYPRLSGKNYFKYISWWNKFFKHHKEYSCVHSHVHTQAALHLKIAHKYGFKTISHSHNSSIPTKNRGKIELVFRRKLIKQMKNAKFIDYRLACSTMAGTWLYGDNADFKVINNAIELENFRYSETIRQETRNNLNILNRLVIGHIGNGTEAKNHKFLLEVFKRIHEKRSDSVLLLVGKLEDKETMIRQYIRANDLENSVKILGVRDDVPNLLMAMDVFVFPSTFEGLGIVLVEAQTTGLPCIASDIIPHEADMNLGLMTWLSLNQDAQNWANVIINKQTSHRKDWIDEVSRNGFSVNSIVKTLSDIYLNI